MTRRRARTVLFDNAADRVHRSGMARPKPPEPLIPLGFRLPTPLVARIDGYCERMEKLLPGHRVSRSDAIRVLLEKALAADEAALPVASKAKRARPGP